MNWSLRLNVTLKPQSKIDSRFTKLYILLQATVLTKQHCYHTEHTCMNVLFT
jgi:hypothetical protein